MSKKLKRTIRTIRKELLPAPLEWETLETAAQMQGLRTSEFLRHYGLLKAQNVIQQFQGVHQ